MANDIHDLKPGRVVRLMAGGPAMTVHGLDEDNFIICMWFTRDGELHRDKFRLSELTVSTPDAWEPEPPADTLHRSGFR